jgi:LPPG:FO 2-phospho-L-lactate transferase
LIDGLVIDRRDERLAPEIERTGVRVLVTDAIMRDEADRERVARETLAFARELP